MNRCNSSIFLFLSRRFFKPLILFSLIFFTLITSGCTNIKQVSYDIETYLTGNTEFEKNVSTVMPSKKELLDSKITYYMYYSLGSDGSFLDPTRMIYLTAEYSIEKFTNESQRLQELYETHYNVVVSSQFYVNGILFKGFSFNDGKGNDCALAYHICPNLNTISYIAFECMELETMSVANAIKYCLPDEREDKIVDITLKTEDGSVS